MKKIKLNTLSAIVIVKNEEKKIGGCLESVRWVDELIVVDNISADATQRIARRSGAKVFSFHGTGYSKLRNFGLSKATSEWVLYIDADERSTPELKKEIETVIDQKTEFGAFAIPRRNIILQKEMRYGGWWPDYVKRLFKKDKLTGWTGDLHEEPQIVGELGVLKNPLTHLKHANLEEMVQKSNLWSVNEAKLLLEANHPKMVWWRFLRIMATELFYRLIWLRGFLDGPEGVIYAFYQMWYRFLVYANLWEMQLKIKN